MISSLPTRRCATCVLAVATWLASACTASFPAQPSTSAQPAQLAIRFGPGRTRLIMNTNAAPSFVVYTIDSDGVYSTVTDRVTWTVSNPAIIRSIGFTAGQFQITQSGAVDVYASYQGLVTSISILVRPAPPYPYLEIAGFGTNPTVDLVSAANLRQSVTNSVAWASSNPKIATVDAKGTIAIGTPGNVEITATFSGLSDSYWTATPPRGQPR